jgi:hypothetical protein
MLRSKVLRPVLVIAAALLVSGGCICLPGGGEPPATCQTGGTITLGVPTTICLPESSSRVHLTFAPPLGGDTVVTVTCESGASDLLVETSNASNYSCGSWSTNDSTTRTITGASNAIEFGVNQYINGGVAPGEAIVTVTADNIT